MDDKVANEIIDFITAKEHQWTIIVSSKNQYWKASVTEILLEKRTNYLRFKNN
jgi:hypothetical protein